MRAADGLGASMTGTFYYFCNHCDWPFDARDAVGDAWGDGVQHYNDHHHEGGVVKMWDGSDYVEVDEYGNPVEAHHHSHHHGHHHGHDKPHIF